MKIACSTVACPGWTLDQAAMGAASMGYQGLDMRAFLDSDACFACNPMDTDAASVETLFDRAGIDALALSTGVTLDEPVFPPVIGRLFQNPEAGVGETKRFVEFAIGAQTRFVRIFPGSRQHAEPRAWGDRRIGERLTLAGQTARNTPVRVLVENTGSYARAQDLRRLMDIYGNQWTGAVYNIRAGVEAGDDPVAAIDLLRDQLWAVRVSDTDREHHPVLLGEGVLPAHRVIDAIGERGLDAWVIYEYPKFWLADDTRDPRAVLTHAADTLYSWIAREPARGLAGSA